MEVRRRGEASHLEENTLILILLLLLLACIASCVRLAHSLLAYPGEDVYTFIHLCIASSILPACRFRPDRCYYHLPAVPLSAVTIYSTGCRQATFTMRMRRRAEEDMWREAQPCTESLAQAWRVSPSFHADGQTSRPDLPAFLLSQESLHSQLVQTYIRGRIHIHFHS